MIYAKNKLQPASKKKSAQLIQNYGIGILIVLIKNSTNLRISA